jgi:elongation factor P
VLAYNEITEKKYIVLKDEPYEVLSSHVFRKQKRKPVNVTKLKNLITGKVVENSFHVSEKVEGADIENKEIKYLYNNKGEFWFCEKDNPKERFEVPEQLVGEQGKFIKENSEIIALVFNQKIIGLKIPIKVELEVVEAQPAVKGNTAQGATKEVVLETGASIQAPLFVKEGDVLRINTEKGEYVERVN